MSEAARPRAPERERLPPSRTTSIVLWWRRLQGRLPLGLLVGAAAVALLLGAVLGRVTSPTPTAEAARAVEATVLPLALDADGIWTSGSEERPPVSEAFIQLRRDGNPSTAIEHQDDWLRAYDAVLVQLAGPDLPTPARPVQRQFIAAVTMSRDAVEVLGHAASVEDPELRRDLLTEVSRLRQRSEQLTQSARASLLDLDGQRADVSPPAPLTTFQEGRR